MHISVSLDVFAEETKCTGLWDVELAKYSLVDTRWIFFNALEYCLRNYGFKPTWTFLIVEILANQANFLEPSGESTAINCAFFFCTTNVFGCFCNILSQFELVKQNFPNDFTLQVWKHTRKETMLNVSAHQLPRYYQPHRVPSTGWTVSVTWYTLCNKILQNFWVFLKPWKFRIKIKRIRQQTNWPL